MVGQVLWITATGVMNTAGDSEVLNVPTQHFTQFLKHTIDTYQVADHGLLP